MVTRNIPVQMIAHCAADGEMQPLRFRFEDGARTFHTVYVDRVLDSRKVEHVGVEALIFLCRVTVEERQRVLELKYTLRSHKWTIFREIY